MKSTLCRREPWAAWLRAQERQTSCLGWIRTITWPASGAGGLPVTPPSKERVGEGGFEPPTARFQTAHADLTALLAEEVVALATGTACTSPRKRNEPSSESKHDDRSPRTSHNAHTRTAVGQMDHHLLSVGDGSVSRTHHVLLMRQLLTPLSYPPSVHGVRPRGVEPRASGIADRALSS
jgi:hypothetical protein